LAFQRLGHRLGVLRREREIQGRWKVRERIDADGEDVEVPSHGRRTDVGRQADVHFRHAHGDAVEGFHSNVVGLRAQIDVERACEAVRVGAR
jgi:hypothetical protein